MFRNIKPYRLLVVEDNPGDYVLLAEYLRLSQLPVEIILHAENMASVPAFIEGNNFDIALLDLTLPDSSGVESVITLSRLLPKTPVIVLSGLSTIEIAVESISLGAQDYLIKGEFDEKLLTKSIQYGIERKKTTEKLRESNERYEFVNKATNDTIWEWDYNSNSGLWGEGMLKNFGYFKEHLYKDNNWANRYLHPDDIERVQKRVEETLKNRIENWEEEFRFRSADGTYREIYDRGFILYNENGSPYKMYGAMADITRRRKLERELSNQELQQQKLITEASIDAQEKEKNLLGNELHDNINQILATVKMYLSVVMKGEEGEDKHNLIGECYKYLDEAIEEIRKLSKMLVSPSLGDIGLKEAIEELAEGINITKVLRVQLIYENTANLSLGKKMELMLYRIIQEQLNNIQKHAKAVLATISIKIEGGIVLLSITDNGVGFDTALKAKGIGLKNMKNRVVFYSGDLKIISSPGNGSTLEVTIPLKDNSYEQN